jgi:hypothetical protein
MMTDPREFGLARPGFSKGLMPRTGDEITLDEVGPLGRGQTQTAFSPSRIAG